MCIKIYFVKSNNLCNNNNDFLIEMAYGQWGNLAGYIYGTAVYYTLNPPDTRTPQEIHKKVKEETKDDKEDHDITSTEKRTDADEDTEDKNKEDEEDQPNDSAD